jgi:hypothetical protein
MSAIGDGVRVVCIFGGPWTLPDGTHDTGPAIGSIWTIGFVCERWEQLYFTLREWNDHNQFFAARDFRPLDGDAEMERLRAIAINPAGFVELPSREAASA